MKTFTILSTLLFGLLSASAQSSTKYSYLVVRMPSIYDKRLDSVYKIINAENGNPYAQEIYALRSFAGNKDVFWYTQDFYSHRTDSSKTFYNFFENTTEALQFLSEKGWELISVNNDIKSSSETHSSGNLYLPYTVIQASPVYYFRKTIKE
jgi:hypothetical protein